MDYTVLTEHFVVVVVVACLVLGYIIKHASLFHWLPNDDIPVVLAVAGAILNAAVGGITVENIVYGALMGLASTGMHQGFKKFIEGNSSDGDAESTYNND